MKEKNKEKIIITIIMLFVIFIWWGVLFPFIKYMYHEIQYEEYNPYEQYEAEFNMLAKKIEVIKPINWMNIYNRYYLSTDKNSKYIYDKNDMILENWEDVIELMNKIWIRTIFHWESWQINFKTKNFLLWKQGNEYYYLQNWYTSKYKQDDMNLVKIINENWIIYNPYRFD